MGDTDALKIAKKNVKRAQKAIAKEQKRQEKVREGTPPGGRQTRGSLTPIADPPIADAPIADPPISPAHNSG
jgi:hypothetical protein